MRWSGAAPCQCPPVGGSLQAEAARNPHDQALTSLVGELATRSDDFRVRWGEHDVRYYRSGTQPFRHPLVGDLTLEYDAFEVPADPGQLIVAYSAPAGTAAHDALGQLANWTAAPSDAASITPSAPALPSCVPH